MAKIAPKGKKVTGTSKKDKITWTSSKLWKKNLTVKAGGGNDIINFKKSKYKNTIYGEAGNDKIYGGTGNDKIYGGKGKDTINAGTGNNTIYFNKGDGKDTILNGGGVDTLVFAKETKKTLKAKISGKNIVLTGKKGKNTVILKNYMSSGHSAQYVTIGKKKVKIDTLFSVKKINSSSQNINGTQLRDNINALSDGAVVNALAGDDTINIYGANFNVNPGKGDDVINIVSDHEVIPGLEPPRKGTLTINKGDGSNTINGISNLSPDMFQIDQYALTIKGDGLLRNFHGINYITGNVSGKNLIIKGANGEKLTITDFFMLSPMVQNSMLGFYIPEYQAAVGFRGLFRPEGPTVEIKANETTFISKDNTLAATVDNGKHTVHINSSNNSAVFEGGENKVGVTGERNRLSFSPGTKNDLTVAGDRQSLMFGMNTTNKVTVTGNGTNYFDFYGNNNNITTSSEGHSNIWFYSEDTNKANIVNSRGRDEIVSYGSMDITFDGNYDKDIEIRNNDSKTVIRGITNPSNTELYYTGYTHTKDIVFSHYYNPLANRGTDGEDYITIHAKDENGNILNCDTTIWGRWSEGSFDLESLTKDKLFVEYYDDGYVKFGLAENDLTQYIDMARMNNNIFDYDNGDLLSCAKDYYFAGTTNNDTYDYMKFDLYQDPNPPYDYIHTDIVINDAGGENDVLCFDMDCSWIDFFFDVNVLERDSEGKVTSYQVGDDLIFTNNLSNFLKGTGNSNTLTIKNAFNAETGKIENILAESDDFKLNYDGLLSTNQVGGHDSVVQELVSWLSNGGSAYSSISDALSTTGETRETIATDLTYIYDGHNGSYTYSGFWTLA